MLQSNWSMAAMASKIPSLMILPKERQWRPKSCHLLVQSRIPPNSNVDSVPKSSPSKGYWIDTWNATAIPKDTYVPSVARDSTILLIWNDIREPIQVCINHKFSWFFTSFFVKFWSVLFRKFEGKNLLFFKRNLNLHIYLPPLHTSIIFLLYNFMH